MARRNRELPVVVNEDGTPAPAALQSPMDYTPTDAMLRLRAEYFALCEQRPLDMRPVEEKIQDYFPQHKAAQLLRLMETNPAFVSWFDAHHEFSAKIKYLGDKALGALESVLNNDHPAAANARVKAAQMILVLAGKTPQSPDSAKDKLADAMKNLSSAELKALTAGGTEVTVKVKNPKTLDMPGVPNEDYEN